MADVLSAPVLVLNRYFEPVQVASLRRAVVLLYGGTALAVDDEGELYDFDLWRMLPARSEHEALTIVGGALRIPRVVHLVRYEKRPRMTVRLSRRNLMVRDSHQCQYCGRTPPVRDLNIDHVFPRSRGGQDTWENLVISCRPCNLRKGRRTPEEASMSLAKKPVRPNWSMTAQILLHGGPRFPEWEPFLKAS